MSKRKYPMVVVDWEDACHQPGYYNPSDNAEAHQPIMCRTVGFMCKSDKKRLVVASEFFQRDDDLRRVQIIPRGMVRKITKLEEVVKDERA